MIKRINIGMILGLLGLSYIAIVTFLRDDSIYLLKINILFPMVVITLSLSCITYNVKNTLRALKELFSLAFTSFEITNSVSMSVLKGLYRYSYISAILWILYSGVYVFSDENYSFTAYISFCFAALLYAFIFSEIFIKTTQLKIQHIKDENEIIK